MLDHTHDPSLKSWVESANVHDTDFPIQNLPLATFSMSGESPRHVGAAIGDQVLDVTRAFQLDSMRTFMSMPRRERTRLRQRISTFLSDYQAGAETMLVAMNAITLDLPCDIGDYTDFYASIHHATNVGRMFRPDNPLMPNYKWIPIAYHGRASSIVMSGAPVRRPCGQIADTAQGPPVFAPTRRLDYELELGVFIGPGNLMGEPIPIANSRDHIVGVCLLNDWSARDIQAWEYQPLGPFLGKNFATTISPWVVTMEALEPFRAAPASRLPSDPQPLSYLHGNGNDALRITLEVWFRTARMKEAVRISRSDVSALYWTVPQMIAHHTSNGCPLRACDLIGTGTVSGPEKENRGCLLEMTWRGAEPLQLPSGESRTFLEDGDEVIFRGFCEAEAFRRIGLGECRGAITATERSPANRHG